MLSFLEVLHCVSNSIITAIFNPEILNSYQFLNKYSEILEKKNDLILPFFSIIFFFIFLIKNIFHVITMFIYSFITNLECNNNESFENISSRVFILYKILRETYDKSLYRDKNFTDTFIDALMIFISELIILIAIFV